MKFALLTSAAVAVVFSSGLTALVAEEPAGPGQAPVEPPAGAAQEVRATVVSPDGRQQQSATVARQQVAVGGGAIVTVLRPVAAQGERAVGQEEDVQRERPLTWQIAAGRRLWLIEPATGQLRTCAVHNTSTVGVNEIRCLETR